MRKLLFICLTIVASAAFAEKISVVTIKNVDGSNSNTSDVLARCQVKAGDEYSPEACSRDVAALRDSGDFDSIFVTAEKGTDGIEITYTIKRKLRFQGPLHVKGNDEFTLSKIQTLSELQDGYFYGEADFAAAAERIAQEYRKKFYPDVKVTYEVEKIEGIEGAVNLMMVIEEGSQRKVNEYRFEGDLSMFKDDTTWGFIDEADILRSSFEQFPWWNPIGWFTDKPATELDLANACEKIAELYRNKGYLDVKVEMPYEEVLANGKVDKIFKIDAGVCYTVGNISVTGAKNYPNDVVVKTIKNLKSGDVASQSLLNEAAHAIEVFCGSGLKALAETKVSVRRIPHEDNASVVDLMFVVKEGIPVSINRVLVRGNDYTKDKVIRREINLSPGDPMLYDKAEKSKRRLENLRYFERVRYYLEPVAGSEAEDGKPVARDLVYEVAEKNTGNFMVGIGASSVDSVFGTIELSESNFDLFKPWRFRGAGQKGRLSLQAGPRYQSYEAQVIEPYFMDRFLELSVTAYRRQRWYDEYDIIRSGFTVQLAYPVKFWHTWEPFGRLGFAAGIEYIEFDDVEDSKWYVEGEKNNPVPAFKNEEEKYGDSWEVPFEIFWANDTRDTPIFATRGYKTKIYGNVVGGDNQYWRVGVDYRHYVPVWKKGGHVFTFGIHGATEDTFSDEMPIYNRFFLGGPRNIRGVEYREISPWLYSMANKQGDHVPWGGKTLWYLNFEYTIPIVKMLRFAAFSDLGSVGEDDWDFDTEYFCWSVGMGLRIDLPQFPIRLDVATPVNKKSGTEKEVFSFTIGYDF